MNSYFYIYSIIIKNKKIEIMKTYSILDFNSNTLKTFPKATNLESFAGCLWNYEKRTTNNKGSEIIKEWLLNDDDREELSLEDVSCHIANNLVYSKHHLVINRRSATSEEKKTIYEALERVIDNAIIQLTEKGILTN